MNHPFQLIRTAIERCDAEDDWVSRSRVGANLMAAHPDFDTRSYGFAKLSGLIKAIPKLELAHMDNSAMVRLRD